jgi:hypothetical protein
MPITVEFPSSTAIVSPVTIEDNLVSFAYVSNPTKMYQFNANPTSEFISGLQETVQQEQSVGRFIANARRSGTLTEIVQS